MGFGISNIVETIGKGIQHQLTIDSSKSGAIKSFDNLEHAQYYMKGMRLGAEGSSNSKKYIFRLRARGPRIVPEVISHYLELDWKHFVKTGQFEGTFEDYKIQMAIANGCRYARARANQDLPTKFGKRWTLYRNFA